MRCGWALAGVGVVVLAVTGCAPPAGTDGDLTNGWPAFPAARTPTPGAGVCYPGGYQPTWHGDFGSAVDCASRPHQTETVFVGAFTGADAAAPPAAGSQPLQDAFAGCVAAARDYLGGEWTDARITMGVVVPDAAAWTGGARWYRCDVTQYTDSALGTVATAGSVKGGLLGARPLAIGCITATDDGKGSVTRFADAGCDQPHNGEYAGAYLAPAGPWPTGDALTSLVRTGCESVVAQFLGFSGSTFQSNYLAWMATGFDEDRWTTGDRSERCYVLAITGNTVNDTRILGSVKGLRDGAPRKA